MRRYRLRPSASRQRVAKDLETTSIFECYGDRGGAAYYDNRPRTTHFDTVEEVGRIGHDQIDRLLQVVHPRNPHRDSWERQYNRSSNSVIYQPGDEVAAICLLHILGVCPAGDSCVGSHPNFIPAAMKLLRLYVIGCGLQEDWVNGLSLLYGEALKEWGSKRQFWKSFFGMKHQDMVANAQKQAKARAAVTVALPSAYPACRVALPFRPVVSREKEKFDGFRAKLGNVPDPFSIHDNLRRIEIHDDPVYGIDAACAAGQSAAGMLGVVREEQWLDNNLAIRYEEEKGVDIPLCVPDGHENLAERFADSAGILGSEAKSLTLWWTLLRSLSGTVSSPNSTRPLLRILLDR